MGLTPNLRFKKSIEFRYRIKYHKLTLKLEVQKRQTLVLTHTQITFIHLHLINLLITR